MSLVSRLVLGSPTFARQMMESGGLAPRTATLILAPTNPPRVLIDALLAVSLVSGNIQGAFREYSVSIQGTFSRVQGTFREHSGNI
jgi:hypothetical protein